MHVLLALRDWLEALGVRQVAMKATGVYWKPVWAVLEDRLGIGNRPQRTCVVHPRAWFVSELVIV